VKNSRIPGAGGPGAFGRARRLFGPPVEPSEGELGTAGSGLPLPRPRKGRPGMPPGIEPHQLRQMPSTGRVRVVCIDYGPEHVEVRAIEDLGGFAAQHRPEWTVVRWINVDGLTDMKTIHALSEKYELHPLAVEDLLHLSQRPKVDVYGAGPPADDNPNPARLYIVLKMLQLVEGRLESEQISIFLGHRTVLTFQESPGDVWEPIRERIQKAGSLLRRHDASFLCYALLDAVVDHCFPILEHFGERLEKFEELVLTDPRPPLIAQVHQVRRELLLLRREAWPMREVIHTLHREPHECMGEAAQMYLRDVYDHCVQIIDLCETYREVAAGLTETYMSSLSIRLNEVVKVLTLLGTIFIPLTFLAGVYGMNMPIPENRWSWSYPAFWAVSLGVASGMLLWFKRKGWL
jgi:magnesium transporter